MEIARYMVLSTAHVRIGTAQLLNHWSKLPAPDQPAAVASTHHGWFVLASKRSDENSAPLPSDLATVLKFAREHACAHVLFHCDGPEEVALPLYPW